MTEEQVSSIALSMCTRPVLRQKCQLVKECGSATEAKMPIMSTTTNNSMRVKPKTDAYPTLARYFLAHLRESRKVALESYCKSGSYVGNAFG